MATYFVYCILNKLLKITKKINENICKIAHRYCTVNHRFGDLLSDPLMLLYCNFSVL